MSDLLRTHGSRADDAAPEADRDAKIEQLLLAGLDHYFAGQYDQAVNVWTRVLFLDRSHARARAYIDRARSAQAERQRATEELLRTGAEAIERGDGREGRRLVQEAIARGGALDEAAYLLERLDRQDAFDARHVPLPRSRPARAEPSPSGPRSRRGRPALATVLMIACGLVGAGAYSAAVLGPFAWGAVQPEQPPASAAPAAGPADPPLALPRSGEIALTRARALAATGHLRDALAALDRVRLTDPERPEAERLRGEIQLQLIALTSVGPDQGVEAAR